MKFKELKDQLDMMTQEQLAADAIWWGDDRGGAVLRLDVLKEDYVNLGDGMEPRSAYDGQEIEDEIEVTMKAGTPVLISDR